MNAASQPERNQHRCRLVDLSVCIGCTAGLFPGQGSFMGAQCTEMTACTDQGKALQHDNAPPVSIRPQYAVDWTARSCDVQQCCEDGFTLAGAVAALACCNWGLGCVPPRGAAIVKLLCARGVCSRFVQSITSPYQSHDRACGRAGGRGGACEAGRGGAGPEQGKSRAFQPVKVPCRGRLSCRGVGTGR